MKRMLSVLLALALMASTATVAFAKKGDPGVPSGKAEFGYLEVDPGEIVELDTDWFYGSWKEKDTVWDPDKDKYVTETITVEEPVGSLFKEYHTVSASWRSGGQYVQSVYFEEGDSFVSIEIKGGISSTVDREVSGTVKIVEKNVPNRSTVTYECDIEKGTLIIKGIDEKSRMIDAGDKHYELPYDYQERQVRFSTEDGDSFGTFTGEFKSERTGEKVAQFQVRISDQSALYLGFSEVANKTIANKYPDADIRYINWTARPTFDREGTLSIYMDPDEYIYGLNDDNTLYRLGGKYDSSAGAYVITTKTLGSYLISDTQLSAGGASGSEGSSSSSSSAAPSSTAAATTPSSTTQQTQQPASTAAPQSSSSEDPADDPEEEPEEPDDDDDDYDFSYIDPDDDDDWDNDNEDEEKTEKKKFPLVPVLFGILGVAILILAVVVVGNRNSGSKSRSRRRRYDDDWDD